MTTGGLERRAYWEAPGRVLAPPRATPPCQLSGLGRITCPGPQGDRRGLLGAEEQQRADPRVDQAVRDP